MFNKALPENQKQALALLGRSKILKVSILKSLACFADAEDEPMPKMIKKVSWKEIKSFLEEQNNKLVKEKKWA